MGRKERRRRHQHLSEVDRLRSENAALRAENLELRRDLARAFSKIEALRKDVAALREKLGTNSSNSSLPPSSNGPGTPPEPPEPASGRKPGGQPGHPRHVRPPTPPDKVTRRRTFKPPECRNCHALLLGEDLHPEIVQQTELPEPEPMVTESELHSLSCLLCGEVTTAHLPPGTFRGPFGPRLQATVALYSTRYHLSDRKIVEVLRELHGVEMSVGSVADCREQMSRALAGPVEEAQIYARQQPVKYADETHHKEGPKRSKAWIWLMCTPLVTVFLIQTSRTKEAAQRLLGKIFGVLVTDRFASYNWWPLDWRQVCWAHLKRDFQRFIDAGGRAAKIGTALQDERRQLFRWWHRVRDGTLSRATFRRYVAPMRLRVRRILQDGAACSHAKTAGSCAELLKVEPALWTFVRVEGVEPTNNTAERSGRPAVIKRKLSFGTHSPAGSRFLERMLTVTTSLRQQGKSNLEFLVAALQATVALNLAPSLIPTSASNQNALP